MKKQLLCLMLSVLFVTACEQDVYDKGDSTYSYVRADFVEAYVDNDRSVSQVLTDDDVRLQLTAPYAASWIQRPDTTYRAVLYYNQKGQQAEAVNLQRVSTASIKTTPQVRSGAKTDPLKLESVWLSGNMRYLNLSVILMMGAVSDEAASHALGIVGDTIMVGDDGLRTYHLRLAHSQGDVPQYYSQRVYFSVPVYGLPVDSLRLSVNTYDGVVTKGFRL